MKKKEEELMSDIDSVFRQYNITRREQREIMGVMDKYRDALDRGESVSHAEFERDIFSVFGGYINACTHSPVIDYHFCEYVAKTFMEDRRWEEVFPALYGDFAKYGGKIL